MPQTSLKEQIRKDLLAAIGHLEYSSNKIQKLNLLQKTSWDEEELETLESFSSRFARVSDIFISKFLRFRILEEDPGFRGSLIDSLNFAEKINLIEDAKSWLRIRSLRNVAAHDYAASDLLQLFKELLSLTPTLLQTKSKL